MKRANKTKEIANTHAVRDAVLVERTRRRHGPGRQRGVVGERGEEGFQLEVRTERVCGPLCGDATKALLRMSQMVVRRRRHRHFGFGLGSSSDLPGPYVTIITWARQVPATGPCARLAVSHVNTPLLCCCPSLSVPSSDRWAGFLPFLMTGRYNVAVTVKIKKKKTPSSGTLAITPNTELCARMYAFMHASVGPAPRCLAPLDFLCIRPAPPEFFFSDCR